MTPDPLMATGARLYPTLSANPERAALLVRCERWVQENMAAPADAAEELGIRTSRGVDFQHAR